MSVLKVIAGVLLATAGGSTCAMNSASTTQLGCTVSGGELLPPETGGADALCDAIRAAAQEAGAATAGARVEVRVINAYGAAATVTAPDGRTFPPIEVSISDRPLNRGTIGMLAREIARRLAQPR
ncbi:hypothetical protein [Sphingomonas sp.]|uniref:hypothetical protein n=1 Tax=Sphingomonas sp. TaxID=28214 RepID=UPI00286D8A56|nr:hypothetical protein [Sphingomonas sp.]